MLSAVVFDFDGIIVDTEPLHYRAFQMILEPLGLRYSWVDYVERYMGFDDREAFHEAFAVKGRTVGVEDLEQLINRKAAAFQQIAAGVKPYPGVVELIRAISGKLPLALCSGALPSDIHPILLGLGLTDAFDTIVTAADVAASKPDPASYLLALERLRAVYPAIEIVAGRSVAIEDTVAGIASARGAGLAVLAVTNSYPGERLTGATRIVSSLEQVSLADLSALV